MNLLRVLLPRNARPRLPRAWAQPRAFHWLVGLALLGASAPGVIGAQPVRSTDKVNTPRMQEVVYGFFDDRTGDRLGRLRIERVAVEYQRHGPVRVAWRPQMVLEGVDLEISAGARWESLGRQLLTALQTSGAADRTLLRHVRLRMGGAPAREITAATGHIRADGYVELAVPAAGAAPAETWCLWLTGPRAGELLPLVTPVAAAPSSRRRSPL